MKTWIPATLIAAAFVISAFGVTFSALPVTSCADCQDVPTLVFDVKPGSDPSSVNIKKNGLIPVLILGGEDLDVYLLENIHILGTDIGAAEKGSPKKPKIAISYEDVNGDGYTDAIVFFDTQELVEAGILTENTEKISIVATYENGCAVWGDGTVDVVSFA